MAEGGAHLGDNKPSASEAAPDSSSSSSESRMKYPLHWMVWYNEHKKLAAKLKSDQSDLEVRDPRGRTPLMLAVTLGFTECVKVLLNSGANANVENKESYTATHEAVSSGDPDLLSMVLHARDLQKYHTSVAAIPDLLNRIRHTPDFYVEMKWEFTSWVPLLSRVCPSDTYRIYKSGSNVRIDTTLLGFEHSSWQRGSRSYIFCGEETQATLYEVNHDLSQVHAEVLEVSAPTDPSKVVMSLRPDPENIAARLTSPVVCTYVDTEKIHFERVRSGMLWKSDRTEVVNGYEAKVYTASNVEFITKSRVEHLSEEDKRRHKNNQSPLQSLLGTLTEDKIVSKGKQDEDFVESRTNPSHIRPEEYFDETVDLGNRDIGRPRESASRTQRFKATLWLCDTYPLSLAEQVLPIVDLMSLNSSHFAKLRSFIALQLPTGFPVKIEIPLFHVLNARVTFGNINASDTPVTGVENSSIDGQMKCIIDSQIFELPRGYNRIGSRGFAVVGARSGRTSFYADETEEEDDLLQFAIQQSLAEANSLEDKVTVWEALNSSSNDDELYMLEADAVRERHSEYFGSARNSSTQSVNSESIEEAENRPSTCAFSREENGADDDAELDLALKLSKELCEEEQRKILEDEKLLARILELSKTDK